MSHDEDDQPEIMIDARRFAGVWANAVRVNGSQDEITIDFARLDPVEPRGIVVARVTRSPPFLRTLRTNSNGSGTIGSGNRHHRKRGIHDMEMSWEADLPEHRRAGVQRNDDRARALT
jgi:hypothetical protein